MYMLALRGMYAGFGSPMHRCPIRAASPPNQLCHPTRSSYSSRKELLPWPGYSLCLRRSGGNSEPGSATVLTACSVRSFRFDTQIADQYLAAPKLLFQVHPGEGRRQYRRISTMRSDDCQLCTRLATREPHALWVECMVTPQPQPYSTLIIDDLRITLSPSTSITKVHLYN
jgi:hypothetical protein